jgi:glycosyltransferase involved in cell wall biosynthesis
MNCSNPLGRINVALVNGQLNYGGTERQLYELAIRLDKSYFNPVVYCLSEIDSPFGAMLREKGIKVYTLKRRGHIDPFRIIKLARLFKKENINLVHSFLHIPNAYSYAACLLARLDKFIPSVRNCEIDRNRLLTYVDRLNLQRCSLITVNSEIVKMFTANHFSISPDKIKVIYNGIDAKRFVNFKESIKIKDDLSIPKNARVVGVIGKLSSPQKNIPLFLKAAGRISNQFSDVKFLVVGSGKLLDDMKDFSHKLGISEKVYFTGEREDIPEILKLLDVFVLSSYKEGLPNVIMEAMAASKPVVATDVGGVSELVMDEETGFLVPSNNVEKLSQAVIRLLENPNVAKRMGEKGKERIEKLFLIDRTVKQTEKLYLSLFKTNGKR